MKKKALIILIILFLIVNIFYLFYKNRTTYIIFDYDNVIKIQNQKLKKVKINRIKNSNYSKATLLTKTGEVEGYVEIDHKKYETNFYDNNLVLNNDGIIKIGDRKLNNKTGLITDKIKESDLGEINDIIVEDEIDIDRGYILKAKLDDNRTIYNVLDFTNEYIISKVILKNQSSSDIVIYDRRITDFTKNYSKLSGIITFEDDTYPILILSSVTPNTDSGQCNSVYVYDTSSNKYEPEINCE